MTRILVNGAGGQVASELQALSRQGDASGLEFTFLDRSDWDVAQDLSHETVLERYKPDYLIHTAAYTKVDQAETDREACRKVNVEAPALIASHCKLRGIRMIHYSSDYVFHRRPLPIPIDEDAVKSPEGVYAVSKSDAEDRILAIDPEALILRTSWVYSSFVHNFVKTMVRLGSLHKAIRVVNDQTGCPTYAADLADITLRIIRHELAEKEKMQGIYHYCNAGATTWFEFAREIFNQSGMAGVELIPISTEEFGAAAPRPNYSVLDCSRIRKKLGKDIPTWQESLSRCLVQLGMNE